MMTSNAKNRNNEINNKIQRGSEAGGSDNINLVIDMPMTITVELGQVQLAIREILNFHVGSIIELKKGDNDPVDVRANGKLIARGDVVMVNENYGVRISEISE